MVRVLTPFFVDGVQHLKVAPPPPAKPAHGLLPPAFSDAVHYERCLAQLRSKTSNIEKNIYLSQLKSVDEPMFYRLVLDHMDEVTPLIYTPTVGDACIQFSQNYRRPEGIFVSIEDKGKIAKVLKNWPRLEEARICVVTDGSRILGLGDLGINGMPISIGKLSLYVAGAGLRPESTVPICLDLGTNTQKFLDDPLYLGLRRRRVPDEIMDEFMDEFMAAMRQTFPKMLVQFEDFSTDHAFRYLERFRDQYPTFNDDIQGTGAVVLSGFLNAAKLSSAASGRPLSEHRILFLGSGSAGVGVGMQLMSFFTVLAGRTKEQARRQIYYIDSQGLITTDRKNLAEHKKFFARDDCPPLKDLVEIINYVKPTALLGLSTIKGAFGTAVLEAMAAHNPRPIVFPLSNPVALSECTFHEALTATKGQVLFASGSPFPEEEYGGRVYHPGQGNNMYIFPGLGLGSVLCRARSVTDAMVEAAALALADSLTPSEKAAGLLYPLLDRVREVSVDLAAAVVRQAQAEGVDDAEHLRELDDDALHAWVRSKMWRP